MMPLANVLIRLHVCLGDHIPGELELERRLLDEVQTRTYNSSVFFSITTNMIFHFPV